MEALSRGADFALFIDNAAELRALLRENIAALGLGGVSRIFRRDATNLGAAQTLAPFSLIFVDPPYARGLAEKALGSALAGGWIAPAALIVVEEAVKPSFAAPDGFDQLERRGFDVTELSILRGGSCRAASARKLASMNCASGGISVISPISMRASRLALMPSANRAASRAMTCWRI